MSELLKALEALGKSVHAIDDSAVGPWLWLAWFLAALLWSIRHVRRHMEEGKVNVGHGQTIGHRTVGLDYSGASMFRSSWRTERRPSISPFYGRPAILRALPYPAAVAYLYLLLHHTLITGALTAVGAAWGARRVILWGQTFRHRRAIVRPMAQALGPALGERPDVILTGTIVPRDWMRDDRKVTIPVPDHHRPSQITDAVRIVGERLGGEWNHVRSPEAPYYITLSHKPAPPVFVSYESVAHLLTEGDLWHPLIGIGTEQEERRLDFDGHVVHLGISAGTGAGKSTIQRLLLTQNAIKGVKIQIGIDVKGDSFEGCEHIPGFHLLNDIGDLDTLNGLPAMWKAIRWVALEMDARRKGERGPKETWEPIFLFLEEQNMFADYSHDAWQDMRDKEDPKTPPVFRDIRNIGFMGRSFKVRMVWAGQTMSANAVGGGNMTKGGELRAQFGNKMLARFQPSQWDNLVGTRPRGQSSDIPGRWLLVTNSGQAQQIQVPMFEPEDSIDLLTHAGIPLPAGPAAAVPHGSPDSLPPSPYEIPWATGDRGTGTANPAGAELPDNVKPFRARTEKTVEKPSERRYTLKEACEEGVIAVPYETAKKRRQRAQDRGEYFPEGRKDGRSTTYTADELQKFYADGENGTDG